mgnify:CR=1 FL=1
MLFPISTLRWNRVSVQRKRREPDVHSTHRYWSVTSILSVMGKSLKRLCVDEKARLALEPPSTGASQSRLKSPIFEVINTNMCECDNIGLEVLLQRGYLATGRRGIYRK